nr:hypothetical protein [Tanacetum cinerariifolium]
GKARGELAEGGFDAFAKMLQQELLRRRVRPFAGGLPRQHAAVRQIHGHGPQAGDVPAGVDVKLHGHAGAGGDDLHLDTVKPLPLAGRTPPVGRAGQQFTTRNACVVAHGHGKGVYDVAGLGMQLFQHLAAGGEQGQQGVGKRVQAARKAALVQPLLAPVLLHVVAPQREVAPEEAGGHQRRGQHLRVGEAPARVGRHRTHGAGQGEQIVEEAVHCNVGGHVQAQVLAVGERVGVKAEVGERHEGIGQLVGLSKIGDAVAQAVVGGIGLGGRLLEVTDNLLGREAR